MKGAKGRRRSGLFADVLPCPFSAQKVCFLFALVGSLLYIVVQVAVVVAVVAVGFLVWFSWQKIRWQVL
jgi:hypothetical protein